MFQQGHCAKYGSYSTHNKRKTVPQGYDWRIVTGLPSSLFDAEYADEMFPREEGD